MTRYTQAMTTTMITPDDVSNLVRAAEADGIMITHEQAEKIIFGEVNINDLDEPADDVQPEDLDYGFVTEGDEQFYRLTIMAHDLGEHKDCHKIINGCEQ